MSGCAGARLGRRSRRGVGPRGTGGGLAGRRPRHPRRTRPGTRPGTRLGTRPGTHPGTRRPERTPRRRQPCADGAAGGKGCKKRGRSEEVSEGRWKLRRLLSTAARASPPRRQSRAAASGVRGRKALSSGLEQTQIPAETAFIFPSRGCERESGKQRRVGARASTGPPRPAAGRPPADPAGRPRTPMLTLTQQRRCRRHLEPCRELCRSRARIGRATRRAGRMMPRRRPCRWCAPRHCGGRKSDVLW